VRKTDNGITGKINRQHMMDPMKTNHTLSYNYAMISSIILTKTTYLSIIIFNPYTQ